MSNKSYILFGLIVLAVWYASNKTIEHFTMSDYADIIMETYKDHHSSFMNFSDALESKGVTDKNINNFQLFYNMTKNINPLNKAEVQHYITSLVK